MNRLLVMLAVVILFSSCGGGNVPAEKGAGLVYMDEARAVMLSGNEIRMYAVQNTTFSLEKTITVSNKPAVGLKTGTLFYNEGKLIVKLECRTGLVKKIDELFSVPEFLALSPSEDRLAAVSAGGAFVEYNLQNGVIRMIKAEGPVKAVAWNEEKRWNILDMGGRYSVYHMESNILLKQTLK